MQQGVQTDATCNIQQCWELLANNVASVCTELNADTSELILSVSRASEEAILLSLESSKRARSCSRRASQSCLLYSKRGLEESHRRFHTIIL